MPFSSDFRMLIPQQSSTTPVRPAESINTKKEDDLMGHTPFGYRIENGKAVIDEATASQVRNLYKNYLSGLSLTNTAKEAGLDLLHAGAKRMMLNRHYLGDDFYPAIIDPASFDAVSAELTGM